MHAHLDATGNVCGRYEGASAGSPCLMLGSHYTPWLKSQMAEAIAGEG